MGAGLGWGRRWPWKLEKRLPQGAELSLCLSFFLPLLLLPTPRLEGASAFPKASVEGNPPHLALGGRTSAHWPASLVFLLGSLITD